MYYQTIQQFNKILGGLNSYLDKAEAHAEAKKYDVANLLSARLAPDQFHFVRQVQATCDGAKAAAARLSGQTPPIHEDNETTIEQLRERIAKTRAYLEGFQAEDFAQAHERLIALPFIPGKGLNGPDYLVEMVIPNFYFHLSMAYAILRHNGIDLGKQDFIVTLNLKEVG